MRSHGPAQVSANLTCTIQPGSNSMSSVPRQANLVRRANVLFSAVSLSPPEILPSSGRGLTIMLAALAVSLFLAAGTGQAWAQAQSCPESAPNSQIFGYRAKFLLSNGIQCDVRFRTLEEAEAAVRASAEPDRPQGSAQYAYPFFNDFSAHLPLGSQGEPMLDYTAGGSLVGGDSVRPGESRTGLGYLPQLNGWPPGATAPAACAAQNAVCNIEFAFGGSCPTAEAEHARTECHLRDYWESFRGWDLDYSTLVGSITIPFRMSADRWVGPDLAGGFWQQAGAQNTDPTGASINMRFSCPGQPNAQQTCIRSGGASGGEGGDPETLDPLPAEFGGTQFVTMTQTASGQTRTYSIPLKRREGFACPQGYAVNLAGQGVEEGCFASTFKAFIEPPTISQDKQCEVGDPCVPGNGGTVRYERGFEYGAIEFRLTYNSLRQLRPYAFIDKNWNHSFSDRILTSLLTRGHTMPGSRVYLQDANGHLEVFTQQGSVFRSRNSLGKVMRVGNLHHPSGHWNVYGTDGRIDVYDEDGRPLRRIVPTDPRRSLAIEYVEPSLTNDERYWRVSKVTDGTGRFVAFNYGPWPDYRLMSVTGDHGSTLLSFGYGDGGNMTSLQHAGGTRQFRYNESAYRAVSVPHHLTGVIDEAQRRHATYKFDNWGRAIESWSGADAERVQLAYFETMPPPGAPSTIVSVGFNACAMQGVDDGSPVGKRSGFDSRLMH